MNKNLTVICTIVCIISLILVAIVLWRVEMCLCKKTEKYTDGAISQVNSLSYDCYDKCHTAKDPSLCPQECVQLRNAGYKDIGILPSYYNQWHD